MDKVGELLQIIFELVVFQNAISGFSPVLAILPREGGCSAHTTD